MAEAQSQSLLPRHYRIPHGSLPHQTVREATEKQDPELYGQEIHKTSKDGPSSSSQWEYTLFLRVLLTTAISAILFASDHQGLVLSLSSSSFDTLSKNRATVQIIVQLLSNIFALCQVTALCTLINRATRLRFIRTEASLDDLQFWSHLCTPSMTWRLPFKYLIALLIFIGFTMVPSALWAGALSPISVSTTHISSVMIPSYQNASLIREYPSEFDSKTSPQIRTPKGVFTYRVGVTMEGSLLSTAASATTVDGSPRNHVKLDDSGYTYIGRSYGVGASAGLTDTNILTDKLTTSYSYQENGYNTKVQCIYNSSAEFLLYQDSELWIYEAIGQLPNSYGTAEESTYVGHSNASIVAIGVAARQTNGTQYMGIAAGPNYAFLDKTQCSIDYLPTLFNITVDVQARNITIAPILDGEDISPSGNLSHTATRQLELISNDQTNLYQSLLGNSFMASIGDYNTSQVNSSVPLTETSSTLAGLTNSVTAMLDAILVGYASAQLMVGNQTTATEAIVTTTTMKIGQRLYIIAIFVLNLVIMLVILEEAFRTGLWKGLGEWDYMNIKDVVLSSRKSGKDLENGHGNKERVLLSRSWVGLDISGKTKLRFDN
ncbi:hypothetical protein BDZ45DRAFT_630624 [Acephala macrosclerotiorum]|nr:hypothetical protein BDZ45DRAFT_630624 [Acephala macrosclerotiorum]